MRCGGSPWVCTVKESNLLVRRSARYLPKEVSSRRSSQTSWQLVFSVGAARLDALRAASTSDEVPALAADLERARLIAEEVERRLAPDFGFWLALALAVLLAAAGAFLIGLAARPNG